MKRNAETAADGVEAFVASLRKYVNLVDQAEKYTPQQFLFQCAVLLAELYRLGLLLPDVKAEDTVEPQKYDPSDPEERKRLDERSRQDASISRRIDTLLGEYRVYSLVFDPFEDSGVVKSMLGGDLAEIYLDLIEPLGNYETGDPVLRRSTVWEWKFTVCGHAGHHIVNALKAIHWLVVSYLGMDAGKEQAHPS